MSMIHLRCRKGLYSLNGKPLWPEPSQEVVNHSPTGFQHGYGGSGPAQLALAVCLEVLQDHQKALKVYQRFKWDVVAFLPRLDFDQQIDFSPFSKLAES